jgi:hypothetical protein
MASHTMPFMQVKGLMSMIPAGWNRLAHSVA